MTTENHRRNARDDAHIRRICGVRPEVETALGLIENHGALLPPTPESKAHTIEANVAWRKDLESQATESRERLLDARVFAASLEFFRFVDEEVATHKSDPDVLASVAETLLIQVRSLLPAEPEQRFDAIAKRIGALPSFLEATHAMGATLTAPHPELQARARDIAEAFPELLRALTDASRAPDATGRAIPQSLQAALKANAEKAQTALEAHRDWIVRLEPKAPAPLGKSRYDELLRLRGLDLTSTEVLDLSRSIAEELRLEQARVIRRAFKNQALDAAIGQARKNVPLSLGEAIAWLRELVDQARTFVHGGGAVPVLSPEPDNDDERLHCDLLPPPLSPLGQHAVYLPPQPYAPRQDALLLVREPLGPQQEALRELSVADLESIVGSMGFPGKHLMAVWRNRTTSIARRGALLGAHAGPASSWGQDMVEGWGLVASELMRELNFRHSPASRLIMLRHALLHTLLACVDVNLGLGRFTVDNAAQFLVERAGLRLPVARAHVRTLLAKPTSGLSALVGKVRIEQLRREARRRWRDGFSDRRFTTLLMVNGPVPLAYLFERLDEAPTYLSDVTTGSVEG